MSSLLAYFHALDADAKAVALHAGRIALILVIAWLLEALAARLLRLFRTYMERRIVAPDELPRLETLGRVFRYATAVLIVLVAGSLVLGEVGISVAPILATAGVAGVAIGFGAQSLVKDYFTGFFLLLEDQVRQGDVVEVAGKSGLVEEVTLRYIRLRDFEGHVHFVPNGQITVVTNNTRGFAHAVIEIGIDYDADVDKALAVMKEVGQQMRADAIWGGKIAADPEIIGVERFADSAVIVRCRVQVVPPIEQWNVRREFLKRLKSAYAERGIGIPFPHLTIHRKAAKSDAS